MKDVLKGLQPENVFYYFEQICRIPHGSGDTKRISDYCVSVVKEAGLFYVQDEWNNLIVKKPAAEGYEQDPAIMLQGHIDMVNEKVNGSAHDFTKDPLDLHIDGDWIFAKDTTLGGDDGIAAAYMLAILTDSSLEHPALECVFTVDEEIGLIGAEHIDLSGCKAKYLINMDSEEEGIFLTSCAGGATAEIILPVRRKKTEGIRVSVQIDHLLGGHSGTEIHKERANADLLMGRLLFDLMQNEINTSFSLVEVNGGTKDNAIPRSCRAELISYVPQRELEERIKEQFAVYQKEYAQTDPDMEVSVQWYGKQTAMGMVSQTQGLLLFLLRMIPNGVQHWSTSIENLVETSLNLGIVETREDSLRFVSSVRSSVNSRKQELLEKLQFIAEFLGGELNVSGSYPGWEYRIESRLRTLMADTWEEMYGKKPSLQAIHAGLECGIIAGKLPQIDIMSMGPDMKDIHTPKERLSISSTERCYRFVLEVLRKMK